MAHSDPEKVRALVRLARSPQTVACRLSAWQAYHAVAGLQLATRHPEVRDDVADQMTAIAEMLGAALLAGMPDGDRAAVAEMVSDGFNPLKDVDDAGDAPFPDRRTP